MDKYVYCVDCKYHEKGAYDNWCCHPQISPLSLVTKKQDKQLCKYVREPRGGCGLSGWLFEPKEA